MPDVPSFAADVFQTISQRFEARAADILMMTETTSSFEEWLNWEAFLACKHADPAYLQVTAKPRYETWRNETPESVPTFEQGDLAVGDGPDDSDRWLFFEFALLHDGNRTGDKWREKIRADFRKLKSLGWEVASAMLFVVAVSKKPIGMKWNRFFESFDVWNLPTAHERTVSLPGDGVMVMKAFDVRGVELEQVEAIVDP